MNPDKALIRRNYNIICALIDTYEKVAEVLPPYDLQVEEVYMSQLIRLPIKQVFIEQIASFFEGIICELVKIEYLDHLDEFKIGFNISLNFDKDSLRQRLYYQKLTSFKEDMDKMLKDYLE